MNYAFHLLIYLSIYAIVAMSLNIVVGYCGLLSMAHAAYFAVGSYAYALATLKLGWGLLPSLALGVGLSAILSLALSLPAWRLKGDLFVMVSLAVQTLLFSLFYNWSHPGSTPPPEQEQRRAWLQKLGLSGNPTGQQIKKAYRRLAMMYHLDRLPGAPDAQLKVAEDRLREIVEAHHGLLSSG